MTDRVTLRSVVSEGAHDGSDRCDLYAAISKGILLVR